MQVTRADSDCSKRVGMAEHLIKFRSSPHLNTIKKFSKIERSKMDHIEITNSSAPDPPPPPNICIDATSRSEVHPPLPLDPPPPDEDYVLQVKQEIVDDEYESSPSEGTPSEQQNEPPINCENNTSEEPEISKVPICRDYVRGTCKRPGTCKYAHKYDLTQLVGVYTFCRNYQTSVCTHPNCKYVHATVFEEHHFYRTGILPPHALAHHKKVNVMQPPPPPPPPPKKPRANLSVNTNVSMNLTFTKPPPPLQNEIFQEEIRNTVPPNRSATLKRQWNSIEQFGSSPRDRDSNETFAIKCKHCDIMDFRLQYNKDKVEKMLRAKENLSNKICLLEKKSEKLCTLISALVTLPAKTESHNNGLGSSLSDVKDKTLLEQLKSIVTVSNRLSALGEEK